MFSVRLRQRWMPKISQSLAGEHVVHEVAAGEAGHPGDEHATHGISPSLGPDVSERVKLWVPACAVNPGAVGPRARRTAQWYFLP